MSPPRPTVLDVEDTGKEIPLGWEGSKFPLSKLDLTKLTLDYAKQVRQSPRQSTTRRLQNMTAGNARRQKKVSALNNRYVSRTSRNVRLVSQTEKGWSWLSVKFGEIRDNKTLKKPRKGELAPEIIDAIWGSRNTRICERRLESLNGLHRRKVAIDTEEEIKEVQTKIQARKGEDRSDDNLMDILLHNWTYFAHSHTKFGSTDKPVHAKYCENGFGHFLLSNGQQIHGQFNVQLRVLLKKLRKLLQKLRSQILPTFYQELPSWRSPRLDQDPELEIPAMPPMPQLYPISGLIPIPSEQDECIPNDFPASVFKSPIPKEHPPLILPESLKVPPLILPAMPMFIEDESSIDYDSYKEDPLPIFTVPPQEPLPKWVEPPLTELPPEPAYLSSTIIPPPIRESIQPFHPPLLEPRPCESSYYELGKDERGICDGLCSKYGHKHHFVPGQRRREPCLAKPLPMPSIPPFPFPEFESLILNTNFKEGGSLVGLQIIPEPPFELPPEEPIPPFQHPVLKEEPKGGPLAPLCLPPWKPPKPPAPLGWIAGNRPVFLIDCSAAMAGERIETVQNCLKALFSPGGQGDVAVTHFDIIMYSFDAWSFGDIENSYTYKQTAGSRYRRQLEPMRVNTPETINAALNWVSRWRPAGTTNLSKALEVATSRTSADCIYLFTEGRSDKPVLILKQAQIQRDSIPIHAVGMDSNKVKTRFLKRLSEVTGGQYLQLDSKISPNKSSEVINKEDVDDMIWSQQRIENHQREHAAAGHKMSMKDIYKEVESEYQVVRLKYRAESHEKKMVEQCDSHLEEVEKIRNENAAIMLNAKQAYEELVSEIRERNRVKVEMAKEKWREQLETVREKNKEMVEDLLKWRDATSRARKDAENAVINAKLKFARDLKEVEERNTRSMQLAREHYEAEVERLERKHMERLEDVRRRQKEADENIAAINKAAQDEYEAAVSIIRESNAAILSQTRMVYEEALERAKAQNLKIYQEAQTQFENECEERRRENARKKHALEQRLQDMKRRKEEAVAAHKAEVTRAISEHEQMFKSYNAMNLEHEKRARDAWMRECREIDKENMAAAQRAMEEFEAEQIRIQEENVKLAERRLAFKRRVAQVMKENEEIVKRKKVEWKEDCARAEKEYEVTVSNVKEAHKAMIEQIRSRNAEKLQSSLVEHKARVVAVEAYNETVRPYVEASNTIRVEIRRIEAFLACIADSVLPPNRHVMEKNPTKSRLEKDLDLLAVSDANLSTQLLIEALGRAYGQNWKTEKKGDKKISLKLSTPSRSRFSGLLPIHPARAAAHSCMET